MHISSILGFIIFFKIVHRWVRFDGEFSIHHRFRVCGTIVIDKLPESLTQPAKSHNIKVTKTDGRPYSMAVSSADGSFCTDCKPGSFLFSVGISVPLVSTILGISVPLVSTILGISVPLVSTILSYTKFKLLFQLNTHRFIYIMAHCSHRRWS